MIEGYAIKCGGKIDITTVSATARAAKVNWLVTACSFMIFNFAPDEKIEEAWIAMSTSHGADCILVTVTETVR